jgi:ABC-2 type transport system ATP-binding protein
MAKLKVEPGQKISSMSCGQRSQVALGLILAQDPDLLILDDFSMGLDPGYRRLFIDYLRAYAKAEKKTIFTTSHIISDMERLIDDVLIMDYNRVLEQCPVSEFMENFKQFNFEVEDSSVDLSKESFVSNVEKVKNSIELYTYESEKICEGFSQKRKYRTQKISLR